MHGSFISFEGIDGCGKSTVASIVSKQLEKKGFDTILTSEPTHTWLGNNVRHSTEQNSNPFVDLFLFMADRADHTCTILDWIEDDKIILCDRYMDSTIAYQGVTLEPYFHGKTIQWLKEIHRNVSIKPNMTFLLIVDPKIAMHRISNRTKRIKFERAEFLKKVQKNYLSLAKMEKRFIVINASKPLKAVTDEIISRITKRMKSG